MYGFGTLTDFILVQEATDLLVSTKNRFLVLTKKIAASGTTMMRILNSNGLVFGFCRLWIVTGLLHKLLVNASMFASIGLLSFVVMF